MTFDVRRSTFDVESVLFGFWALGFGLFLALGSGLWTLNTGLISLADEPGQCHKDKPRDNTGEAQKPERGRFYLQHPHKHSFDGIGREEVWKTLEDKGETKSRKKDVELEFHRKQFTVYG